MLELLGGLINGVILSLLALAVFISFRVFEFSDVTVDGSFTMGAAITAVSIVAGVHPLLGMLAGCVAGAAAGATTAFIHTRFGVHRLLAGILMMTALYSVNLRIMGQSNVPLIGETTVMSFPERWGRALLWRRDPNRVARVGSVDARYLDFRIRARSSQCRSRIPSVSLPPDGRWNRHAGGRRQVAQMIRALGVSVENMTVLGLMLANSLAALAGSLFGAVSGLCRCPDGDRYGRLGAWSIIIGDRPRWHPVRSSSSSLAPSWARCCSGCS